jgi:hypothetical protein
MSKCIPHLPKTPVFAAGVDLLTIIGKCCSGAIEAFGYFLGMILELLQ